MGNISVLSLKFIEMVKTKLSLPEQIKEALDGRTQRWLSLKMSIPEDTLSKKMLGAKGYEFTSEDIASINEILQSDIKF